jgi:dethiobiotin synthetase
MPRPEIVVVAGTATEVGKTFVAAALITVLREAGERVAARKPVQSFSAGDVTTDAVVLAAATDDDPAVVCPPGRSYPVPMAPPMAAEVLDRPPFTIGDLVAELTWPDAVDLGVLEAAGGVRSPIAADGDSASLARALEPQVVVLVADAGLGTINAVRLSVAALAGLPVVVVLNRFDVTDDLHRRNREWLEVRDGYEVVTEMDELAVRIRSLNRGRLHST